MSNNVIQSQERFYRRSEAHVAEAARQAAIIRVRKAVMSHFTHANDKDPHAA